MYIQSKECSFATRDGAIRAERTSNNDLQRSNAPRSHLISPLFSAELAIFKDKRLSAFALAALWCATPTGQQHRQRCTCRSPRAFMHLARNSHPFPHHPIGSQLSQNSTSLHARCPHASQLSAPTSNALRPWLHCSVPSILPRVCVIMHAPLPPPQALSTPRATTPPNLKAMPHPTAPMRLAATAQCGVDGGRARKAAPRAPLFQRGQHSP